MATFSQRFQKLLASEQPKTLQAVIDEFQEKSFAILFLLLLSIPALPLPTGGVSHVFEIIALLLAIELIAGRKTVWLPRRWINKTLPKSFQSSALPKFIKLISWFERHSRQRLRKVQSNSIYIRIIGLIIFVFTLFAFLAPPFSGLDTMPSLGVVLVSFSLIFEDTMLAIAGLVIGSAGIGLVFLLGKLAFQLF